MDKKTTKKTTVKKVKTTRKIAEEIDKKKKPEDVFDAISYGLLGMNGIIVNIFGKLFGTDNTDLDGMSKEELKKLVIGLRCEKSIGDKIASAISKGLNTTIVGVNNNIDVKTDLRFDDMRSYCKGSVEDLKEEMQEKISHLEYAYEVKDRYNEYMNKDILDEYRIRLDRTDFTNIPKDTLKKIDDLMKESAERQRIYNKGWNECRKTKKPQERNL